MGPHHLSDHVRPVHQPPVRAPASGGFSVATDEPTLGTANRRKIDRDPQVAREAAAARVGPTLSVAKDQIRPNRQAPESIEQRRKLAEREITRHIRKTRDAADADRLHDLSRDDVEDHGRSEEKWASAIVGDVRPRHVSHWTQAIASDDPLAERVLQFSRRCHIAHTEDFA